MEGKNLPGSSRDTPPMKSNVYINGQKSKMFNIKTHLSVNLRERDLK